MHVRQILFHMIRREEVDVLQPQWFEDVLLKVVVQSQASDTFNQYSGPIWNSVKVVRGGFSAMLPVNIYSIFPPRAWLIDKRLGKDIKVISRELVKTCSAIEIVQIFIEERISEPSWNKVSCRLISSWTSSLKTNQCAKATFSK